ncbi:MAG: hypothetical protein AAGF74_10490 [Pseudomonadota bacterium]
MVLLVACIRHMLRAAFTGLLLAVLLGKMLSAQQMPTGNGLAFGLDLQKLAREVDPRNAYDRALYDYLRANQRQWDDPIFYVNFLIYLMAKEPEFRCEEAFANEFERTDYFRAAPAWKEALKQIVNTTRLPNRFDVAYVIDTGEYNFDNSILPFDKITSIGMDESLSRSMNAPRNARGCASSILQGTGVSSDTFPWQFRVVDERQEQNRPSFPFGNQLRIPTADARTLFERFGRELFAIVSYQFQAATNGDRMIMVVPTDGQLFGLGKDAVVRIKTHAHPTMSQPGAFDFTSPMTVRIPDMGTSMKMRFEQQGFRAVGVGSRDEAGTALTAARTFPVNGSAAVGQSAFIMRLETEGLRIPEDQGQNIPMGPRQVTFFGSVDFSAATASVAPLRGTAFVARRYDPQYGTHHAQYNQGFTRQVRKAFVGAFRPAASEEPAAAVSSAEGVAVPAE